MMRSSRAVLRAYVFGGEAPTRLRFPSWLTGEEAMLVDCRKMLDAVAKHRREEALGESGRFPAYYCAARLQTLDGDAPVSPYTVGKELGHGGRHW
ncbi:MAG: hypothetical protein ACREMW_05515 [Gemmatimonadales bacterium]